MFLLQLTYKSFSAKFIALQITAHTSLAGSIRICSDTFTFFEIGSFIGRKRHKPDSEFYDFRFFIIVL